MGPICGAVEEGLAVNIKQFIVSVHYDPEATRWMYSDASACETLHYLAQSAVDSHTEGARPAVSVFTIGERPLVSEQIPKLKP